LRKRLQHLFTIINTWTGINGELTGNSLHFKELPNRLMGVPLRPRQTTRFMHDKTPVHFSQDAVFGLSLPKSMDNRLYDLLDRPISHL
jgi:hypothetical protein